MKSKQILRIGVPLTCLLVALGLASSIRHAQQPAPAPVAIVQKPPEIPKRYILVAATSLDVGTHLTMADFKWVAWPEELAAQLTGAVSAHFDKEEHTIESVFRGAVVKTAMIQGEFITPSKLFRQGIDGSSVLSYILKPGDSSVTLPLDMMSGAAGLLQPGDHVDVYLTQNLSDETAGKIARTGQSMPRFESEAILHNIPVIAIDRKLSPSHGKNEPMGHTMTLELTQDQVKIINIAQHMGTLTTTIRSVSTVDEPLPKKPFATTDVAVSPELFAARLNKSPHDVDMGKNPFIVDIPKHMGEMSRSGMNIYRGSESTHQSVPTIDGHIDFGDNGENNGMIVMRGPQSVVKETTPEVSTQEGGAQGLGNLTGQMGSALSSGTRHVAGVAGVTSGLATGSSDTNNTEAVPYVPYVSPQYLNSILTHR